MENPLYIPPKKGQKISLYIPPNSKIKAESDYVPIFDVTSDLNSRQSARYELDEAQDNLFKSQQETGAIANLQKAADQSFFTQGLNGLYQGLINVGSLAVQGIMTPYQLAEDTISEATGGNADFTNPISTWAKETLKTAQEKTAPIYLENPNKAFDVGDFGWWANGAQSIASTYGMLLGGKGVLSLASKAFKNTVLANNFAALGQGTQDILKAASMAVIMRDAENRNISNDVYNSVLNSNEIKKIDLMSDEEFNNYKKTLAGNETFKENLVDKDKEFVKEFVASSAGWKAYADNAANVLFDFIQISAMMGVKLPSILPEKVSTNVLKSQYNSLSKTFTKADLLKNKIKNVGITAATQGTEGIEEIINEIGQRDGTSYGKYLALTGVNDSGVFSKLGEYLKDPLVWEQGFWGVIGGIGTTSIESATKYISNKWNGEEDLTDSIKKSEIQNRSVITQMFSDAMDIITKGFDPISGKAFEGTSEQIAEEQDNLFEDIARDTQIAMQLNAVRSGNTKLFKDWLNSENTVEIYEKFGTFGNKESVKNLLTNISDNTDEVQSLYNKFYYATDTNNTDAQIRNIVISQGIQSTLEQKALETKNTKLNKDINDLISNNVYLNQLSAEDKTKVLDLINNYVINESLINIDDYVQTYNHYNQHTKDVLNKRKEIIKAKLLEDFKNEVESGGYYVDIELNNGLDENIVSKKLELLFNNFRLETEKVKTNTIINDKKYQKNVKEDLEKAKKATYNALVNKYQAALSLINENTENFEKEINKLEVEFKKESTGIKVNNKDFNFKDKIESIKSKIFQKENRNSSNTLEPIEAKIPAEHLEVFNNAGQTIKDAVLKRIKEVEEDTDLEGLKEDLEALKEQTGFLSEILRFNHEKRIAFLLKPAEVALVIEDIKQDTQKFDNIIANTGGENSINSFNPTLNNNSIPNTNEGNVELENKEAQLANKIYNNIRVGDKVFLLRPTKEDFNTNSEYIDYLNNKDNSFVVKSENGFPILFLNSIKYLEEELVLTNKLLTLKASELETLYKELYKLGFGFDTTNELKLDSYNKLKQLDFFKNLFPYDISDKETNDLIKKDINHLVNIIYFSVDRGSNPTFNQDNLNQLLTNWKLKIERDYKNHLKIQKELGNKESIETNISYIGGGSVLIAKNEDGETIYNSLNETLGKNEKDFEIPLFVKDVAQDGYILKSAVTKDALKPFSKIFTKYNYPIFTAIKLPNGEYIPQPISINNLKSKKDNKTDKARIAYIFETSDKILELLNKGKSLRDIEVVRLKEELNHVTPVNKDNSKESQYLTFYPASESTSARLSFLSKGENAQTEKIIIYKNNKKETYGNLSLYKTESEKNIKQTEDVLEETEEGTIKSKKSINAENAFKEYAENFIRNYDLITLENNDKFIDPVTQKEYPTYREYLIKTDAFLTYVGKVIDKQGNKISNIVSQGQENTEKRDLIINISTDFKQTKTKTETKTEEYKDVNQIKTKIKESKFDFVLEEAEKLGVNFFFDIVKLGEEMGKSGKKVNSKTKGGYWNKTVYYTENLNKDVPKSLETIAHELLHGVIDLTLLDSPLKGKLKEKLAAFNLDLLEKINKNKEQNTDEKVLSLLNNPEIQSILKLLQNPKNSEEVITYGFTNAKFAELLTLIDTVTEIKETKKETFWTRLKNLMLDILPESFKNNKLKELNQILDDIFRENEENRVANTTENTKGNGNTGNKESNSNTNETEIDVDDILLDELTYKNQVNFKLKSIEILQTPKADEIFKKADKNNWNIDKILLELNIPKEQKELIKTFNTRNREEILTSLLANYSYTIEINTAKEIIENVNFTEFNGKYFYHDNTGDEIEITKEFYEKELEKLKSKINTQHYSNLTVPGGTNYTENEIATPAITPSLKGHAQFATDKGIGWFRSDEMLGGKNYNKASSSNEYSFTIKNKGAFDSTYIWNADIQTATFRPKGNYGDKILITKEEFDKVYKNIFEINFSTDNKTRRILEVQSDLFQKGRDREELVQRKQEVYNERVKNNDILKNIADIKRYLDKINIAINNIENNNYESNINGFSYFIKVDTINYKEVFAGNTYNNAPININKALEKLKNDKYEYEAKIKENEIKLQTINKNLLSKDSTDNQFLQLLNKDNNWVTFFVKSIVQDSSKKGYEKVLFPSGNTASKVEGHTTLEEFKKQKEDRLKQIQPNVILPIGTSGSGKSTFIKSLPQENLVVIEPDAMRVEFTGDMNNKSKDKEIYIEAANRAIQAIKQGKQVVFDTTNLTKDKRLPFIEAIKKAIPTANIQYKLMELNPELAKQRIKADIAAGKNRANVPDATIGRHAESYKQMLEDIKSEPISNFENNQTEINQLKQELERVETEGFGALKPIYNFYENTVTNILKKQGFNPNLITDEYGNTWNEISLQNEIQEILLDELEYSEKQEQEWQKYNKQITLKDNLITKEIWMKLNNKIKQAIIECI